jgi:hypothetical protein
MPAVHARFMLATLCLWLCHTAAGASVEQIETGSARSRCQALGSMDFSNVVDAPTQISSTRHIDNSEEVLRELADLSDMPREVLQVLKRSLSRVEPMCQVTGYVSPNVGFLLVLPDTRWNGKFLHLGCFGWCGDLQLFTARCALNPRYACIGTDMGHRGAGGLWLRNNLQGQIDFSYRATHVVTLAGKAVIARYYGEQLRRSYFMGCSTGGYQALVEAQRYPFDFNGIIAGAPDMDEADLAVRGIWIKQHYLGADGQPMLNAADIQLVHRAALARCDLDDGLKDGIISDPVHCRFDPSVLQCASNRGTNCLSEPKVRAVKGLYGVPKTSSGIPLSTRGVLPGSELNWAENFANVWGESFFQDTGILSQAGETWTYRSFDFETDYPRSGAGILFADTNPDLRRFRAAGGKLVTYQGGNDAGQLPGAIVDYYETVERTMGGAASTQGFFRLFIVPGMNHCGGGEGAFAVDYLTALEAWDERDEPPEGLVASHVDGIGSFGWLYLKYPLDPEMPVAFTRPVYPYPKFPRYSGRGDPHLARSFQAATPASSQGEP